jgi:hypothetical protein
LPQAKPRAAEQDLRQGFGGSRAVTTAVIPGHASSRGPGIHTPCVGVRMLNEYRGYGFRARSLRSRPGMTI